MPDCKTHVLDQSTLCLSACGGQSNNEEARRFQPCGLRGVPIIHCGIITAQVTGVENSNDFIIAHNFVGQELGQAWLGKPSVTDRGHAVVCGRQMGWSRRSRVASLMCMAPDEIAWESGSAGLSTRARHVAFPAKASQALSELHVPVWGLYVMESYTIDSCVWLLWLNIMFVRFIHTMTGSHSSFFFIAA